MRRLAWVRLLVFSGGVCAGARAVGQAAPADAKGPVRWQGRVPGKFNDPKIWGELAAKLLEADMFHGAVAVAHQIDAFFLDVTAKEIAYGTFVKAIDKGYPFSIEEFFKTSFFEPDPRSYLGKNYYFYKGKLNQSDSREKWSEYYLAFIKDNNFSKYQFFQALAHYQKGELQPALQIIDQILKKDPQKDQVSFFVKVARTKARILYEQGKFQQSQDIYENFLLKTDPVVATDWIESAWNLYFLKKYDRALGFLYNLETNDARQFPNLEKFILRATVYKSLCARGEMDSLTKSFEAEFGPALEKIRQGAELKTIDLLAKIRPKENDEFVKYFVGLNELRRESGQLGKIPGELRPLAEHVFATHAAYLRRMSFTKMLPFLDKAAEHLIILGESLKFLKYDVDRSLFNPDAVFLRDKLAQEISDPLEEIVAPKRGYEIRWQQRGDIWRDEKLAYKVRLADQCATR